EVGFVANGTPVGHRCKRAGPRSGWSSTSAGLILEPARVSRYWKNLMSPRSALASLLFASCCSFLPAVSLAQNSAFSLWDQLVDHPDFSEAELLGLAQYVKAELSLFRFHLELCQQELPESEEAVEEVTARFEAIGA